MVECVLVEQMGLVEQEDGMDALLREVLDQRRNGVEDARCSRLRPTDEQLWPRAASSATQSWR